MKQNGRVYWITGLPGSGKTTIGTSLYYDIRLERDNVIILTGDTLKDVVDEKANFTIKDRFYRARKYANLCKMLSDQGIWVIICTVSMFDEIREWNRKNIDGYIEIFLDASMDTLCQRNKRGLFYNIKKNLENNSIQFPKHPDCIINNNGDKTISECVNLIKQISPMKVNDFNRDSKYWNIYYNESHDIEKPSDFALFISSYLRPNRMLLDLGCGNGRDSLFFLQKGLDVVGIDASETAINKLKKNTDENAHAEFICDDFVKCRSVYQRQYDYIYSRFTLHAIKKEQEIELWKNITDGLKKDGRLFIEARTIHDDLYGKGRIIDKDSYFYNNHFRRFINPIKLRATLEKLGLKIEYLKEGRNFSRTMYSDPVLLRVVAVWEN